MVCLWKTEAPLSQRRKVEEGKREAEKRKREKSEEEGKPRKEVGTGWSRDRRRTRGGPHWSPHAKKVSRMWEKWPMV